ncbi:MAG: hypothetical protein M3466_00015 [Gemmatimonadota bacterium]|nr:hypothetical protein [Gemmatimonadota bacterium]
MMDLPARIVAVAARLLHGDRREWGAAMAAELAQLRDGPSRWQFALGCFRAALIAPPLPNARAPGTAVTVTFLAGVAGCITATAHVLTTWPHAADDISLGLTTWFAASLAAYLWIALRPPHALVAHGHAARRGAAVGLVLFLVTAVGRSAIDVVVPPSNGDAIVGTFLAVTVVGTLATAAFAAARAERSFGAGVTAALWAGLVCSILAFNADLLAILVGFNLDVHMRHSMPDYYTAFTPDAFMSRHIGGHLASSMEQLRTLPLLALILGSIGAAVGRRPRAVPHRAVTKNVVAH